LQLIPASDEKRSAQYYRTFRDRQCGGAKSRKTLTNFSLLNNYPTAARLESDPVFELAE
jgi:hypothetical protein